MEKTIPVFAIAAILSGFVYFSFGGMVVNIGFMFYTYLLLFNIFVFLALDLTYLFSDPNNIRLLFNLILIVFSGLIFIVMAISADMELTVGNHFLICWSNVRTLDTALKLYEQDNKVLPENLDELKPKYLAKIPTCWHDSKGFSQKTIDHYYSYYGVSLTDYAYEVSPDRHNFTVFCKGFNHPTRGLQRDYPLISSYEH
ncbi:MAG: hypothetical protein LWY06_05890 [Firmicutes bacterium]|nr:hypothetical protein [Bacillota bacterium]